VVRLGANFDRFSEAARADGKKHEFLESELVPSVRAAIDDIERGGGKHVWRLDACQLRKVLIQRHALLGGGSICNCNGYAKDSVGTELAFVWCAIELDQKVINLPLCVTLRPDWISAGAIVSLTLATALRTPFVGM